MMNGKKDAASPTELKRKVLFVCTGNTCRSPMAEMILKNLLRANGVTNVKVSSAGTYAEGGLMAEKAVKTLRENKCRITVFKSKQAVEKLLKTNNIVICMTRAHKEALGVRANVYTLGELTGCGDISDPYGQSDEVYLRCFKELEAALMIFAEKFFGINN